MSAAHTPGPWFTTRCGFSTVYVEARIPSGFVQEVAACGPTEKGTDQQDANARLIAAAPDLLAALIGVLRVADRKTDEFDAARAAIAKAGVPTVPNPPRFEEVFCSSCGGGFGPGDFGFSGCDTHAGKRRTS